MSRVVFDSKISRKVSAEDLKVSYSVTEEELDLITKLFQAYKISKLTAAPTLETFLKELVFSNSELFKEKSNYNALYLQEITK